MILLGHIKRVVSLQGTDDILCGRFKGTSHDGLFVSLPSQKSQSDRAMGNLRLKVVNSYYHVTTNPYTISDTPILSDQRKFNQVIYRLPSAPRCELIPESSLLYLDRGFTCLVSDGTKYDIHFFRAASFRFRQKARATCKTIRNLSTWLTYMENTAIPPMFIAANIKKNL